METGVHKMLLQDVERKIFLLHGKGNGNKSGFFVREVEKAGREGESISAAAGRSGRRRFISFTDSGKNGSSMKAATPKRGRRLHWGAKNSHGFFRKSERNRAKKFSICVCAVQNLAEFCPSQKNEKTFFRSFRR